MAKTKKDVAKENMAKAVGLEELYNSDNFRQYLLPYLQELSRTEKIRPDGYTNRDDYLYKLEVANIRAQVYDELVKFLAGQTNYVQKMKEIITQPVKNYSIGDALQTIEATTSTG